MRNKTATVITVILVIIAAVYAGYQVWDFFYTPYSTEIATSYSLEETMHVKGLAVRDETVIDSNYEGSVSYVYEDASRVNKNKIIAYTHASSDTVLKIEKAEELKKKISSLEEASNNVSQLYGSYEYINKEIGDSVLSYVKLLTSGNLSEFVSYKDNLLLDINRKISLTGQENNFEERIALLRSDYSTLIEQIEADQAETVLAPKSGYFISEVDGFETIINSDNLFKMSVSEIENIIENGIVESQAKIGKIADSYKWYFVFSVPNEKIDLFKNKNKILVKFNGIANSYKFSVYDIIKEDESENSIVVLQCNKFTSELASLRISEADLVIDSYSGLKISNECIRFDDDQRTGVFILEKSEVKFKYIDILYQTSTYSIVSENEEKNKYLHRFDEIFIGGNDLYDGKIIDS